MKQAVVIFLVALLFSLSAVSDVPTRSIYTLKFPKGPNQELTPGSLCHKPTEYRYPERIPYCRRNVESQLKREIIRTYDSELGYKIGSMDRQKFKIDHLIPLCAGGSNEEDNLWPQHESVYTITDPLEPLICEKMAEGRLSQKQAVNLILKAKNDLKLVPKVIAELEAL